MSKEKKGFGKFLTGALVGAGLGILFAPKKGSETREELKNKMDELINNIKNTDMEDVKDEVEAKIAKIKMELEDLDKEKVLDFAREKANNIKNMTEDLVNFVVEKGSPVLEGAAISIKEKASFVTNEVLEKLEKKN